MGAAMRDLTTDRTRTIVTGLILLVVLAIYLLRLNNVVGMMVDDAWYLVLAKALSEGDGFRLISSATTVIQPLYPPGFPSLLALVYSIDSSFPHNLWLLKSVSIAAMVGVGFVTFVYLERCRKLSRELAALVAIAVTITPSFLFFATSTVMSECVFTLCQLATVLVVHQSADAPDERRASNLAILAAVLAAITVLVRTAAIALLLAGLIWFLKERRWRRAAWFGGVTILCVLPWTTYSRLHAPTAEERTAHGGAVAYEYTDQLSMRWAGAPLFGRITGKDLLARVERNFVDVFGRGTIKILAPALLRGSNESGEEVVALNMSISPETMAISGLFTLIALIGFVRVARERVTITEVLMPLAFGIIMLWPFWSFRFVVPLTPFLFFYFTRGVQVLAPRATVIVLLSLVGLNLFDHAGYILQARSGARIEWAKQAADVDEVLDWISRGGLPDDGVLVATNPGLIYLRTGRKAIAADHPGVEGPLLKLRGARYVACLYPSELPRERVRVLYHSTAGLWVVEI
jgi:hypothetical protein